VSWSEDDVTLRQVETTQTQKPQPRLKYKCAATRLLYWNNFHANFYANIFTIRKTLKHCLSGWLKGSVVDFGTWRPEFNSLRCQMTRTDDSQHRELEWVIKSSSSYSSNPNNRTHIDYSHERVNVLISNNETIKLNCNRASGTVSIASRLDSKGVWFKQQGSPVTDVVFVQRNWRWIGPQSFAILEELYLMKLNEHFISLFVARYYHGQW